MAQAGASAGHEAPRQRLMIREMVLENFKSYAGEQRVGPFHKSFSAVVGPNGSGKSNVIDAMLFVFGRRAKQLRFNKVSELIHNSQNHRNLECARVTVHFQEILDQDGDSYTVVPGSEFTVARTAQRNNESHYYINGRKVSTKDVTDMLKGKGIDLDNNRFLILQGEVEQISMMKPKAEDKNDTGLLEYLEDIIGTDQYVQPIEEANKKLEEMNEKRVSMVARLKMSEKEKDGLQGKAEEAQMFLDKQAEMLRNRIHATHVFAMKIEANIKVAEGKTSELKSKLEHERAKFKQHEKDLEAAEKKFVAADKAHAAVVKAMEAALEAYKEMERKDAQNNENVKAIKNKIKKLTDKMAADTQTFAKLEKEKAECEEAAPKLAAQVQQLTAEADSTEAALEEAKEAAKGEAEAHRQQLAQVKKELAPWEKKMGEVNARISVAERESELLQRKEKEAKQRLEKAQAELEQARAAAGGKEKRIRELEAAVEKRRQDIEAQKKELAAAQAAEAEADGKLSSVRERVVQLRADLNASQGQSGVIKELMAAKARGELTGIYGRLGDLAAIDAKYDAAVSTAVGALDNVLVETTSDAQRAVEHLRRANAGCATFLILEKQQHLERAANERIDTPEGCPRLFDLIKIKDARLRPAFFYACGNTLVANDLDQASRIAYGQDRRFRRVVTLQGQLIADSGTMSGGGKPQTGRMALGNSAPRGAATDARAAEAELRKAEQEADALGKALQAARDRVAAAQSALRAAEKDLSSLELEAPKARMEAEANAQRATDLAQRMASLQEATQVDAADASRVKELHVAVSKDKVELLTLQEQCADLTKRAKSLEAKIENAGGEKLKSLKTKLDKTRKKIEEAEADMSKKQVQAKAHAKQIEKLKKEVTKQGKDREKLEAELEECGKVTKSIEDDALLVVNQKAEAEAKSQETGAALEEAQKARDLLKRNYAIIRQTEANIEEELERLARVVREERDKGKQQLAERAKHRKKLAEVVGNDDLAVDDAALRGETSDEGLTKLADELNYKAAVLEAELQKLSPDLTAIEEFKQKLADYSAKAKELEDATAERDALRREYEALRKARLDGFMAGFEAISMRLKEVYQMITCGGDAELELVDSLDPFSEGIVFSVRPPKKSWKNISNLSGGEKTLSSLSLVFALHTYKPNPLYVMDEIDAALDFKNVSIVGHYIKERTAGAQFVIISLRNNMFELAERLVGIYKTDNATKTVAINPGRFAVPQPGGAKQAHKQQLEAGEGEGAEAEQAARLEGRPAGAVVQAAA
ncbi:hypothetical protein HYH02_002947 [Chlamydomonas schloesseri]|uniref:Structural maintenance of chromosomes protein n=1 Tax=Chlamydomonas schloesseri TaxID=2026947 RepID=A0A835WUG2_9CHLO|nr:hypothetical protein HYH02_002947 [Chlamydomonas schloesseri]|eukprot:KAG2452715.1 hypothetical protein HYH02_002947 [Chlamydomonas schloesseri]